MRRCQQLWLGGGGGGFVKCFMMVNIFMVPSNTWNVFAANPRMWGNILWRTPITWSCYNINMYIWSRITHQVCMPPSCEFSNSLWPPKSFKIVCGSPILTRPPPLPIIADNYLRPILISTEITHIWLVSIM